LTGIIFDQELKAVIDFDIDTEELSWLLQESDELNKILGSIASKNYIYEQMLLLFPFFLATNKINLANTLKMVHSGSLYLPNWQ